MSPREPAVPPALPSPPARFSTTAAKQAFIRYGGDALSLKAITPADAAALGRLAECYAQVAALQQNVSDHGFTHVVGIEVNKRTGQPIPGTGIVKARAEVAMLDAADRRLLNYLREFGLTPASRAKVQVAETAPADLEGSDLFT